MKSEFSGRRGRRWWVWLELVLLCAVTPLLLFPGGWRTFALLALPLIWIGNRLMTGHFVRRTPFDVVILVLLVMVLVSLYATYAVAISLPAISGTLLGISVFYWVAQAAHPPRTWWLIVTGMVAVGVALSIVGLFSVHWPAKVAGLLSITSRIPPLLIGLPGIDDGLNSNELAGALLWVFPIDMGIVWWLVAHQRRLRTTWGRGRTSVATLLALITTTVILGVFTLMQSRSGYLALAAGGVAVIGMMLPTRVRWLALGIVIIGLMATVLITALSPESIALRLFDEPSVSASADQSSISLEQRAEIWSRAIYGMQDFAFTGMGMGTFSHVLPVLYPMFSIGPDVTINHAHNEFLQAGLDLGVLGLIAFVGLLIIASWLLRDLWRSTGEPLPRALVLALGCALWMHSVYGLTDAIPLGSRYGLFFWALLGLIAARAKRPST